jgi:tRNA (cytidine/uridine-2'-O-)-methyltransferase
VTDAPLEPTAPQPSPAGPADRVLPVIAFHEPRIPQNTGNAIRLAAVTGAPLHLVEPLGFDLSEPKLRRAGLDYHDLARVFVHPSLDACFRDLGIPGSDGALTPTASVDGARVFAFTRDATVSYSDIEYRSDDVLLFGCESDGLPDPALADPRVTERVRFPMLPGRRSLNLSNCAAIAVYEAWRQLGFSSEL